MEFGKKRSPENREAPALINPGFVLHQISSFSVGKIMHLHTSINLLRFISCYSRMKRELFFYAEFISVLSPSCQNKT